MADDKKNKRSFGGIKKIAGAMQSNLDDFYRQTYYTNSDNKDQLDYIRTSISNSIKDIMDSNYDNIGEPNISKFFERILSTQNDKSTIDSFSEIFGDNDFINNLTGSYLDNRWVKIYDQEIDDIIRYMPKLKEALNTIKDNVLAADSFSKDYLHLESNLQANDREQFDRNIADMKRKYELDKLTDEIYDNASTYGEDFIYCVPYEKAINSLMNKKNSNIKNNSNISVRTENGSVYMESSSYDFDTIKISESINDTIPKNSNGDININISIDNSGIIESVINAEYELRNKFIKANSKSLTEQYLVETGIKIVDSTNDEYIDAKLPTHNKFNKTINDDLEYPEGPNTSVEGLYTGQKQNNKLSHMNGAIVKNLERYKTIPIILDDICLGYYYFEFDNDEMFDDNFRSNSMMSTIAGVRSGNNTEYDILSRREELLRNIASNIANKIDTTFINNNQDLKKEIYYILKYDDEYNESMGKPNNIRVSYIPPEDIHHIYFNLDKKTGRGISDLALSLIPAKLWVAIYITNCLAVMTRGNDKRVYYVKQSVEKNISKTLLKTISEIKKSNFNIRQIENLNSILNITGRFNDYIVPRSSDGQSPIDFEIVPGQQIEIKTDLLNLLEESAINPTGVPIEIIQNRQSPDYALQLTMSNAKFLRFVYSRQDEFQKAISPLITKIYMLEYRSAIDINVVLPPPLFINVTNTNQLLMNTNELCDNITNIVLADENDETVRNKFNKLLKINYLGTYLNMDNINNIINKAKQEKIKDDVNNPENLEQ